uniref:Uncharacterized protein n=1 Tax=Arundo donax TaxID=35708 RepID=A0A0A9BUI6_ARUDO
MYIYCLKTVPFAPLGCTCPSSLLTNRDHHVATALGLMLWAALEVS